MKKLTIATSSAALFDLEQSDQVYKQEGLEAYSRY
ncbi:MAG: 5'-nucleotidase, partial [Pseudomonadota bacterium]|nr:5'-nucleotidase [Pseudomonadota bacterium]